MQVLISSYAFCCLEVAGNSSSSQLDVFSYCIEKLRTQQKTSNEVCYYCSMSKASANNVLLLPASGATLFSNLPPDLQILPLFVKYDDLVPFVRLEPHRLQGVLLDELHPTVLVTHPGEGYNLNWSKKDVKIGLLTWWMFSKSPIHNERLHLSLNDPYPLWAAQPMAVATALVH